MIHNVKHTASVLLAFLIVLIQEPAVAQQPDRHRLLAAMEQVESSGRTNAVGDGGGAVGVLQIHPIMLREANRILGCREFTLADRWSRPRSEKIFLVVTSSWPWRWLSDEMVARRWNQGGRWRNAAASEYWRKVQEELP